MVGPIILDPLSAAVALALKALICEAVKKLVQAIGKALGLIKEDEKLEDLGDKALQAEEQGITPDKFKTYEEYVTRIQNFELDPEKSKKYSTEDKMKKSMEVYSKLIAEKYPETAVDLDKLAAIEIKNPGYLTDERIKQISEMVKDDPKLIGDIVRYLSGSETDAVNISNTIDKMINIEKGTDPGMSDAEAYKAVAGMKN